MDLACGDGVEFGVGDWVENARAGDVVAAGGGGGCESTGATVGAALTGAGGRRPECRSACREALNAREAEAGFGLKCLFERFGRRRELMGGGGSGLIPG